MAKAYWITLYRAVRNPEAVAAYAKLAGPATRRLEAASSCAAHRQEFTRPAGSSAPWS